MPYSGKPISGGRRNFKGCMESINYNGENITDLARRKKLDTSSFVSRFPFLYTVETISERSNQSLIFQRRTFFWSWQFRAYLTCFCGLFCLEGFVEVCDHEVLEYRSSCARLTAENVERISSAVPETWYWWSLHFKPHVYMLDGSVSFVSKCWWES